MGLCCRASQGKVQKRKLVVVGDGGCGKTSLLSVFTRGYFPQVYEPTLFDTVVQDITVDDQTVELALWDTAGQEEFNRLRTLSYEGTHVFMLCFSVDDRDSLDNIPTKWVHEVYDHVPDAKVVLVALKCDLRDDDSMVLKLQQEGRGRPVMYEEGLAVARSIRATRYLECSAKHNRGVRECFEQTTRVALSVRRKHSFKHGNPGSCIIL